MRSSGIRSFAVMARDIHIWSQSFQFRIDQLCLEIIVVLSRVDSFPAQTLNQVPKARSKQRAEKWAQPVNPVISGEGTGNDVGTECPGRVDTGAGIVDTYKFMVII